MIKALGLLNQALGREKAKEERSLGPGMGSDDIPWLNPLALSLFLKKWSGYINEI